MASPPLPKDPKRQRFGKAIQRSHDRVKQAIQPSSNSSSQNSGSTAAQSTGSGTASPAPSSIPSQSTTAQSVLNEQTSASGLPTIGPNTTPARPKPLITTKLKRARGVTQTGLETALRVLEGSADVFPPLKSAVSAFIDCLDIVQAVTTNLDDYEELTSELVAMAGTLNQYLSQLGPEDPSGGAASIALSIEAEVTHINKQQSRGKGRRMIESAQDKFDVIKHYHRIEGLFRQLQNDIALRTWSNTNKQNKQHMAYDIASKHVSETREQVQANLEEWSRDPSAAKVYWMNGMAGTGKTTIAYSLCERLAANQQLGASFFCSRISPSCRNVHQIIPTIAYHLARYLPAFQSALCQILEEPPDTSKLSVVWQFKRLVQEPMQEARNSIPEGVVVVIDALDECEDVHGVWSILETLMQMAADLPLKFFVTSRSEPQIRNKMLSPGGYSPTILHLHDIEQSMVGEDIKKYLNEALSSMSPPPSNEQIDQLTKHAGKLFIYAATVVRYVLPGKGPANSVARLNAMLAVDSQSNNKERPSKKYKELDDLYSTILATAFDDEGVEEAEIEAVRVVLRTAVCTREPLTIPTIASLLGLTDEQVLSALQPLRSVLHVSEGDGLVSTLHTSFSDYMFDHTRSMDFCCNQAQHSEFLANRCFDVMKEQLRFNICGLESSFVFDKEVPKLEQRIRSYISLPLFYTRRYWGEHLELSESSDILCNRLADFLSYRLLFWMEVLNLRLCVVKGVSILIQAERWLLTAKSSTGVQQQIADARDFVTRFAAGACSRSTPHIYLSALPLCAKSSSVYAHYWKHTRGLMDVKGTAISRRDKAAQAAWMASSGVSAVAVALDGARIVAGCSDGAIQVWDARTGDTITGPFKGRKGLVGSVAFSPDCTLIVSSDYFTGTIRLWDARTGEALPGLFEGHNAGVHSVTFSPDGTRIASGSDDLTIEVWDAHTGMAVARPFMGHTNTVRSVAFSPDGARIVSGSDDLTIKVWETRKGFGITVAGPFQGHTGQVTSVSFSPNGTRIASSSRDLTIRVWDAHTGDTITGPLEGHTHTVHSAAFSPDGAYIVSGSADQTIRVWDASTGEAAAGPFQGHKGSVSSVAFSPDGTRIVSGSYDRTIQVWDVRPGDRIHEPFESHKGRFHSVAFSPDGTRIAAGSSDQTIQVWDARTGLNIARPFRGHTSSVDRVAFSPDGTRIVSRSYDRTVRVWDACTGDTVAGPFGRHKIWVASTAFSPDGTLIIAGTYCDTIHVWDACTGDTVAEPFEGHTDAVNSIAFSPGGTYIASGSNDQTIRLWDASTGNIVAWPFMGHTDLVSCVVFSPDGTRIASGSCDRTIRVWDARNGDAVAGPFEGHTKSIKSVAFSPSGTCVVSGSEDRTIRVWDVYTGDTVAGPFNVHRGYVTSVVFSPDGTRIASGSSDYTIRLWEMPTSDTVSRSLETGALNLASAWSLIDSHATVASRSDTHQGSSSFPDVPTAVSSTDITDFELIDDGWVTSNNVPLFWVPPDFLPHVLHPRNTVVIGPQGTASIDYRNLLLGERWTECYISE